MSTKFMALVLIGLTGLSGCASQSNSYRCPAQVDVGTASTDSDLEKFTGNWTPTKGERARVAPCPSTLKVWVSTKDGKRLLNTSANNAGDILPAYEVPALNGDGRSWRENYPYKSQV